MPSQILTLPPPARSACAGEPAPLRAAAEAYDLTLTRRLESLERLTRVPERRGAPKQIAVLALALDHGQRLRRSIALSLAVQTVADRLGLSRGAAKKASSEARALLQFGLSEDFAATLPSSDQGLVAALDEMIAPLNMRDVLRARAEQLGGSRGGRPETGDLTGEVRRLILAEMEGDPEAQVRLLGLSAQLQRWMSDVVRRSQSVERPHENGVV